MKNFGFFICMILLAGCAEMNDKHDEFLARGETVYIGKVDSVIACPGNDSLLLKYYISDPRAKTLTVYWGFNNAFSKTFSIPPHQATEPLEVSFGAADGITEENYTFQLISSDLSGNKSMVFETSASVYGSIYNDSRLNRRVLGADFGVAPGDITVNLAPALTNDEAGMEFYYTDRGNNPVTAYFPHPETSLSLADVDISKVVQYKTVYRPEPTAIDSFSANIVPMDMKFILSLNKPVTIQSGDLNGGTGNAAQREYNAVDGNYALTAGRWVSLNNTNLHYMEIDLQGEYPVNSFKTWNGTPDGYGGVGGTQYVLDRLILKAWDGSAWITVHDSGTGNTNPTYGADFTTVTTTKVRFETYTMTRLFEIQVYYIVTH
ncbi:hypothetical protein SAMD00024442_13_43 [Candidatus Symbiothrix dinenymphae]|nr:hypothetical protein SAMD00024442_13_43 [Candidatus Symbiothrix dinenymphae]